MKSFRKAIIFGALAVLAGFFYWYFEVKKDKEKEETRRREALLFEETGKRVSRISLKEQGKEEIVLEWHRKQPPAEEGEELGDDEEGDWSVVQPVATGGDNMTIDTMVKSMLEASSEEVVWESLEKQAEYGLDNPSFSLRFSYEGDDTPHGIDLGKRTLDNKRIFARVVGEERIYTVPATLLDVVGKSLFDVRDKKLAPYEKDDIVGISALGGRSVILLEKEGDEWYFLPDHLKASTTRVDIYTGNLRWESFVEVVEEKLKDAERFGLDKPRLIITFKLADDSAFLFVVGDMVQEGDAQFFYATRSSDSMVFKLKGETVQKLIPDEFHLKDRSIFDFDQDLVSRVTFSRDDQSYTFEKFGEDEWKLAAVENVAAGEDFIGKTLERGYKVDNVIRGLATAEYEEIDPVKREDALHDKTGIDNPRYEVVLDFQDGRMPLRVDLTEKDEQTGRLFLTPDDGDTAYYTSGYFVTNFPESVQELFD
jgi:hypothetical protein